MFNVPFHVGGGRERIEVVRIGGNRYEWHKQTSLYIFCIDEHVCRIHLCASIVQFWNTPLSCIL
jgi:hypothetical protein